MQPPLDCFLDFQASPHPVDVDVNMQSWLPLLHLEALESVCLHHLGELDVLGKKLQVENLHEVDELTRGGRVHIGLAWDEPGCPA